MTEAAPVRVLHFVTGGHVGATGVAITLALGGLRTGRVTPMLALSSKRRTGPTQIGELAEMGIPAQVVADWSHAATIFDLARICREFKPDVLVAHGFSEHLWGRYGGLLAKVPALVHVEHNTRERYTRWRLAQARWLARRTAAIVGCSEGVRRVLLGLGMPEDRTLAIPNGIRLDPFDDADAHPYAQRTPGIVMCARFSKQKDHETLIRAIALLRERGLRPPVVLAGGGKAHHRRPSERLVQSLGLQDQIQMPGLHRDVPGLLKQHRISVLSTHYEGMPLALVEAMAAGCAVVGSSVPGVQETLRDGETGRLFPHQDAGALADILAELLEGPVEQGARMAAAAREYALREHSLELMNERYESLFLRLAGRQELIAG